MPLQVRPATTSDLIRAFGRGLPGWETAWFGMIAWDGDEPVAAGTVFWDQWGRAWGAFDKVRPVSAFVMHRTAVTVMRWLAEVGEPALYVSCSETEPRARYWLERLGFRHDSNEVWVKCLTT